MDFNGLPAGTIVTELSVGQGISGCSTSGVVTLESQNSLFSTEAAIVFDSDCPVIPDPFSDCDSADTDIGSPHMDFSGPGTGIGGAAGSPYQNDTALQKILVLAKDKRDTNGDGLVDAPDDADVRGEYNFNFSDIDPKGVTVDSVTLMDIEFSENESPAESLKMHRFPKKSLSVAVGILVSISSVSALAQQSTVAGDEFSNSGLEEVTVTAQRREQSLQKTPVAVSAFSADFISENHIEGVQDIVMRIPNFYSDSVSKTQQAIAMRGAGSLEDSPGSDQAVAIFVDDVYIGENSGLDYNFFDIQRIEVLRGPQGTLFGRNVVGGAVNILPVTTCVWPYQKSESLN